MNTIVETTTFKPDFFEDVYDESSGTKKKKGMRIKGIFQKAEVVNANKRLYPREVLEREISNLQPYLNEGTAFAAADHPEDGKNHIDAISAIHQKVEMKEDGTVYGEAILLDVGPGAILQDILRKGGSIGISSRGFGTTTTKNINNESVEVLNEDFRLNYEMPFDFVVRPSTPGATVTDVLESKKAKNNDGLSKTSNMNIEELKKNHPELYKQICDEHKSVLIVDKDFLAEMAKNETVKVAVAEDLKGEFASMVEEQLENGELLQHPKVEEAIAQKVEESSKNSETVDNSKKFESASKAIIGILSEAGFCVIGKDDKIIVTESKEDDSALKSLQEEVDKMKKQLSESTSRQDKSEVLAYVAESLKDNPYEKEISEVAQYANSIEEAKTLIANEQTRIEALLKRVGKSVHSASPSVTEDDKHSEAYNQVTEDQKKIQRKLAGLAVND